MRGEAEKFGIARVIASQPLRAKEVPQGFVNGSSYAVIDHEYDVGGAEVSIFGEG